MTTTAFCLLHSPDDMTPKNGGGSTHRRFLHYFTNHFASGRSTLTFSRSLY